MGRCLAGCLDDRLQNISVADLEPTGFSRKVNHQRSGVDTAKFKFLRGREESEMGRMVRIKRDKRDGVEMKRRKKCGGQEMEKIGIR